MTISMTPQGKAAASLSSVWRVPSSWRVGTRMGGGEAGGVGLNACGLCSWGLWGSVTATPGSSGEESRPVHSRAHPSPSCSPPPRACCTRPLTDCLTFVFVLLTRSCKALKEARVSWELLPLVPWGPQAQPEVTSGVGWWPVHW